MRTWSILFLGISFYNNNNNNNIIIIIIIIIINYLITIIMHCGNDRPARALRMRANWLFAPPAA